MTLVRVEQSDGIAVVTLNRPDALNALSQALRAEITAVFRRLQADGETRVAILTGAGRAFSAGIDLKELGSAGSMGGAGMGESAPVEAIAAFEGPVIGAVNGHAITGGFELALACDLLIASTRAVFGDTHARVGIVPGWGLSQKLPRLIGVGRAKELSFTGNFIDAAQAERWGLVNRVVEPEELLPTCRRLAEDMLSCDPPSLRRYKHMIDRGYEGDLAEGLRLEARESREHLRDVTPDAVAARRADIQRRGRAQS